MKNSLNAKKEKKNFLIVDLPSPHPHKEAFLFSTRPHQHNNTLVPPVPHLHLPFSQEI